MDALLGSVAFTIDEKGKYTGKNYAGTFKAKERLAVRDRIARDVFRRNLLAGQNMSDADQEAASLGVILSELHVRLTEAPDWYRLANNGLDLQDINVLVAIHNKALEVEEQAVKKILDEGQKAAEALKAK